jgi:hypothetical protein
MEGGFAERVAVTGLGGGGGGGGVSFFLHPIANASKDDSTAVRIHCFFL